MEVTYQSVSVHSQLLYIRTVLSRMVQSHWQIWGCDEHTIGNMDSDTYIDLINVARSLPDQAHLTFSQTSYGPAGMRSALSTASSSLGTVISCLRSWVMTPTHIFSVLLAS